MKTPFGTEVSDTTGAGSKRRWPLFVGIGVALSLLVGASFAASITINGGDDIEFGQGNQTVTSCAGGAADLTPTIESAYNTTTDKFTLDRVLLEDVPNLCRGKYLLITLYNEEGDPADKILFVPRSDSSHTGRYALDTMTGSPCTGLESAPDPVTSVVFCGTEAGTDDGIDDTLDFKTIGDVTVETFDTEPSTAIVLPT